jgi:hypothetical protein
MRLTLRTLLAYMDGLLEPADAADLAKKIEVNPVAGDLIRRTSEVLKQQRLSAPKPAGKGLIRDPNTVAEYLDNVLASERVPELEKQVLESDAHLAEAVACHQILSLVLTEPAEVDPHSRRRMYQLLEKLKTPVQAAPVSTEAVDPIPASQGNGSPEKKPEDAVPTYLRSPPVWARLAPVAAVIILLAALAGAIWMAVDPPSLFTSRGGPGDEGDRGIPVRPEMAAPDSDATPAEERAADSAPNAAGPPTPAPADPAESDLPPSQPPAADSAGTIPESSAAGPASQDPPVPSDAAPGEAAAPNAALPPADAGPSPAPGESDGVGRLVSAESMVAWNAGQGWGRLTPDVAIAEGTDLVCASYFRGVVSLSIGLNMELVGATRVTLIPEDERGISGLKVHYGRVILSSAGKSGQPLVLYTGPYRGTAVFESADSVIAIEAQGRLADGDDPEQAQPQWSVDLWALAGQARLLLAGEREPLALKGPMRFALHEAGMAESNTAPPTWCTADERTAIEKKAAAGALQNMSPNRPLVMALQELAVHRRAEVAALAVRTLALLGDFEPSVNVLNDESQRAFWNDEIKSLRAALASSPATAIAVRQAFVSRRGEMAGQELYRMLWGYTPEGLMEGAAWQLVDNLDHDELDFRVLAFWNLRSMTGYTAMYQPEDPPAARRTAVNRWRQRLEAGQIVPAEGARPSEK